MNTLLKRARRVTLSLLSLAALFFGGAVALPLMAPLGISPLYFPVVVLFIAFSWYIKSNGWGQTISLARGSIKLSFVCGLLIAGLFFWPIYFVLLVIIMTKIFFPQTRTNKESQS